MILSADEVEKLTDRPQPKKQIEWLTRRGWVFEVGASGRPKVSRTYFDQRMGNTGTASHWEPDWSKV